MQDVCAEVLAWPFYGAAFFSGSLATKSFKIPTEINIRVQKYTFYYRDCYGRLICTIIHNYQTANCRVVVMITGFAIR